MTAETESQRDRLIQHLTAQGTSAACAARVVDFVLRGRRFLADPSEASRIRDIFQVPALDGARIVIELQREGDVGTVFVEP